MPINNFLLPGAKFIKPYEVANSCRWNDGDSPYMHRTISASNRRTFTISFWIKRSKLGSPQQCIFSAGDDASTPLSFIGFNTSDQLNYWEYSNNSTEVFDLKTTRVFRDVGSWYHICIAVDTTQATESNRVKYYINGVQDTAVATGGTNDYPATQSQELSINEGDGHYIGRYGYSSDSYFDGYIAEFCFIDGTAYTASDFGEFDDDSPTIWKPKDVSGLTFGTNGAYLDFEDSSNLGNDANGGTDWTEVNLAAADQATDTPTNSFATLNPLQTNLTLSEGNTTATTTNYKYAVSTMAVSSGRWYMEMKVTHACMIMGIQDMIKANDGLRNTAIFWSSGSEAFHLDGFSKFSNDSYGDISSDASDYPTYTNGDIIGMALDLDNNKLQYSKNGTWYNSANPGSGTSNMETIDAPSTLTSGFYGIVVGDTCSASDGTFYMNFGGSSGFSISSANQDGNGYGNFEYSVPSGYLSLCTKNLGSDGG